MINISCKFQPMFLLEMFTYNLFGEVRFYAIRVANKHINRTVMDIFLLKVMACKKHNHKRGTRYYKVIE